MMYRTVELYEQPEKMMGKEGVLRYSEMTSFQRAFLCGLIKEKRPKKIVEVGVSAGGTTALILQCLKLQNIKSEMYSVDLMGQWYLNKNYATGFAAAEILEGLKEEIIHQFLFGQPIPFFLKKIGKDIDFLILDTAHSLPGEYLDFIACLPFLKEGCVVVMHDTIENHLTYRDCEIATKLLFDVVRANDKYYMPEEKIDIAAFPNIAAFIVGKETKDNVRDLFSSMTISWGYLLEEDEKQKYREVIEEHYGTEYLQLFDRIETLQRNTYLQKRILEHYGKDPQCLEMKWRKEKRVFLYGAGYYADLYAQWAELNQLKVDGFVVSDGQEKGASVCCLSELSYKPGECAIVLAIDKPHHAAVLQNLKRAGYDNIL